MKVAVVIPARNEEVLIERCLRSVLTAWPTASIVVVADGCTDRTVAIARAFATVLEIDFANVGRARAVGVEHAIATGSQWIANTDADSVVPSNWIHAQLAASAPVTVGTVRPDELSPREWIAWHATHDAGQAIGHVHGANLGFTSDAYRAVGGYSPLEEHEDNDLVHRLRTGGFEISASDHWEVVTSGRRMGRTPGGYARYLREQAMTPDFV